MQIGSFIIFIAIVLVICSVDLSHNSLDKPTELLLYDTRDDNETLTDTENSVDNSNTQSSLSDVDLAAWSDTAGNSSEEFSPDLVAPSAAELKQADEVVAQQAMAELNKQKISKSNKSSTKRKQNIEVRNLDVPIDETTVNSVAGMKGANANPSARATASARASQASASDFAELQNSLAGRKPSYAGSIANAAEEFLKMANNVSSETPKASPSPSPNTRRRESKPGKRSGNILHQNASAKSASSTRSQRVHNNNTSASASANTNAGAGDGGNFSSDFRSDDFSHVGIATDFDDFSSDDISASDDLLGEIYNNTNR